MFTNYISLIPPWELWMLSLLGFPFHRWWPWSRQWQNPFFLCCLVKLNGDWHPLGSIPYFILLAWLVMWPTTEFIQEYIRIFLNKVKHLEITAYLGKLNVIVLYYPLTFCVVLYLFNSFPPPFFLKISRCFGAFFVVVFGFFPWQKWCKGKVKSWFGWLGCFSSDRRSASLLKGGNRWWSASFLPFTYLTPYFPPVFLVGRSVWLSCIRFTGNVFSSAQEIFRQQQRQIWIPYLQQTFWSNPVFHMRNPKHEGCFSKV